MGSETETTRGGYYWYALILSRSYYALLVIGAIIVLNLGLVAIQVCGYLFWDWGDGFSAPTKGFEATGTPIYSRLTALRNFHESELLVNQPSRNGIDNNGLLRKRRQANDSFLATMSPPTENYGIPTTTTKTMDGIQICQFAPLGYFAKLVFQASDGSDLFNVDTIKSMCRADEQLIRSHPKFSKSCYRCPFGLDTINDCPASWSLGTYVALINNKTSCNDITDVDVLQTRLLLHRCAPHYRLWYNETFCSHPSCRYEYSPDECLQYEAVHNIFHFLATIDFLSKLEANYTSELEFVIHIVPLELHTRDDDLVSIYMDNFHGKTYSDQYVTLKAIDFQIKFDLFDIFLFSDVLYIGIGMFFVVLILLSYTRSILITLAAIVNFELSLLMAHFFYFLIFRRAFFPFVNIVAAVLVIGVGADDTFVYVDLWRKSLSENKGADLHVIVQKTLHHATVTMLVTSLTTAGSLYSSIISDITAVKCFGLFAGTAIMMNFVLTLTLLPAVIVIQYRLVSFLETNCSGCCHRKDRCLKLVRKFFDICLRPFRKFFESILPLLILKLRYIWLILFGALGIGGALVVFKYPSLRLPTNSEFQILENDNYLEQWDRTYKNIFRSSEDSEVRMSGYILFGIKPTETSDAWDPDDTGSLVLDDSFAFYNEEHQQWLLQFCEDLQQQEFYYSGGFDDCFIESMIEFMKQPCIDPFTGGDLSPCCNNNAFPYDEFLFRTCFKACVAHGYCWSGVRFHNESDELVAIHINYQSSTYVSFDFNIMQNYWMDTNNWMEKQLETAPESLQNGWIISRGQEQLYFYDLQNSLATGAPFALAITLVIVFFILVVTILNIILAFYAILTVAFAVFVTVASLVLLGWELNIFESVILILSVGLCVDFTIHYGVAYRLADLAISRRQKTEFSIETMTGAISVAALSAFLAGVFMLAANINAYLQLGLFLTLVMSVSWVYSTFFFQSLCRIMGPEGRWGDLTSLQCCNPCKSNEISDSPERSLNGQTNPTFNHDEDTSF
ncbi:protein dispatched homolog 1-like [Amphiura filiformis]|uniref:protein dispatched homolog 1-like n=1 Tax=Amphiura filiformis TaxID=82378 RepID=UPI003B20EEE2